MYSGDSSTYRLAFACYAAYYDSHSSVDCYCVQHKSDVIPDSSSTSCFFFSGPIVASDNCEDLTGSWSQQLIAAVAFDVIVTVAILSLLMVSSCSIFCPRMLGVSFYDKPAEADADAAAELEFAHTDADGNIVEHNLWNLSDEDEEGPKKKGVKVVFLSLFLRIVDI